MLLLLLSLFASSPSHAESTGTVTLQRRVEVRECQRRRCTEWHRIAEEPAHIELTNSGQSHGAGSEGWSRQAVRARHGIVKTEIHVVRHAARTFVSAKIRTGRRPAQVSGWNVNDMSRLQPITVEDQVHGRFQARLVLSR